MFSSQLINALKFMKKLTVLTGAGISAESGVPTFRGEEGLWKKFRPEELANVKAFMRNPRLVWEWYDYRKKLISEVRPNPGHDALVKMEALAPEFCLITQNVDGLHIKAGSINVHELHGSLRQVVCMECSSLSDMDSAMSRVIKGENPPHCEDCGGVLKPNTVFFGEALPRIPWEESVELVKKSDLLLTIGSSLQVSPANILPDFAIKNGAKIVIMNQMPTPYDTDAKIVIRDKIGEFSKKFIDFL